MLLLFTGALGTFLGIRSDLQQTSPDLHGQMRLMMQESENDDDGFVNTGDEYSESSSALSAALGPRWNGPTLEQKADRAKKSLLEGIANPKAIQRMNAMLMALR